MSIDEPNLDEQIDEIFTQFLKNDPWTLAEDELEEFVAETKANFKALIAGQVQEARIDELYEAIDVPIANLPSYLADRIAQLRSTPNEDMDN